jgi:hypothetical protein
MYYKDLSIYKYGDRRNNYGKEHLNVGWLDNGDYNKGYVPEKVVDNLKRKKGIHYTKGYHKCPFCGEHRKSSFEYEIKGDNGIYYHTPSLITHYIEEHDYQPPQEFIDAVLKIKFVKKDKQRNMYHQNRRRRFKGSSISRFNEHVVNESNSYISDEEFEEMRKKVHQKLDELKDAYDDFTMNIAPKYWRTTGSFYSEMEKIMKYIDECEMTQDKYIEKGIYNKEYMKWYKEKYPDRNKARKYNI